MLPVNINMVWLVFFLAQYLSAYVPHACVYCILPHRAGIYICQLLLPTFAMYFCVFFRYFVHEILFQYFPTRRHLSSLTLQHERYSCREQKKRKHKRERKKRTKHRHELSSFIHTHTHVHLLMQHRRVNYVNFFSVIRFFIRFTFAVLL